MTPCIRCANDQASPESSITAQRRSQPRTIMPMYQAQAAGCSSQLTFLLMTTTEGCRLCFWGLEVDAIILSI